MRKEEGERGGENTEHERKPRVRYLDWAIKEALSEVVT